MKLGTLLFTTDGDTIDTLYTGENGDMHPMADATDVSACVVALEWVMQQMKERNAAAKEDA